MFLALVEKGATRLSSNNVEPTYKNRSVFTIIDKNTVNVLWSRSVLYRAESIV